MQLRHKFLIGVCASFLALSLFGLGLLGRIGVVGGPAAPLKSALKESGIYQTGISDALEKAQKDNPADNNSDSIPTSNPAVRTIIKDSFPPEYVQSQSEKVIDAFYAWLHGNSAKIAFSLDITDAKNRLANGLGDYAQNRLNTLPTCTAADVPAASQDVDVFNAACVPPGFNKAEAVAKAKNDILNGDFLKDAKFDANNVKNNNGKTLTQQMQPGQNFYQVALLLLYMLAGTAVALAAAILFIGGNWRLGIRRVGIVFGGAGIFTAGFGWLSSYGMHRAVQEFSKSGQGSEPLQQKVIRVVQILTDNMRDRLVWYGLTLVVLGAVGILVWFLTRSAASDGKVLAHKLASEPAADEASLIAKKPGRAGAKPKLPQIKD
jgi:hypothetical protein